jgi:hypothetical protein
MFRPSGNGCRLVANINISAPRGLKFSVGARLCGTTSQQRDAILAAMSAIKKAVPYDGKQADNVGIAVMSSHGSSATEEAPVQRDEPFGSTDDHPFADPAMASRWREIYEKANYENRHRFDPEFKWTAEEEKRLVRKVQHLPMTNAHFYHVKIADVLVPRSTSE